MSLETNAVDDSGTNQEQARTELKDLCELWFDGSVANAAIALGREETEIGSMLLGTEELDDDLVMKIRGLKQQRDEEGESNNAREFN